MVLRGSSAASARQLHPSAFHTEQAEFYYVMSGEGTVTVGSGGRGAAPETASIKAGDAIPINLSEVHSFANTGSAPLEFMIVCASRDDHKTDEQIPARGAAAGTHRRRGLDCNR